MGQSLASYWFFTRFGIPPQELGLMFFASSVLTAISLWHDCLQPVPHVIGAGGRLPILTDIILVPPL